jgi:hypothetical protein
VESHLPCSVAQLFLDEEFDLGLMLTHSSYEQLKNSYTRHEQSIDSFQSTLQVRIICFGDTYALTKLPRQLVLADHFSLSTSVFCYSDMLGEEDEAIRILCARESEYLSQRLRAAVEEATQKFPNAPASIEMERRRRRKAKTTKRRLSELEALQTLAFIANCRAEFNDHHSAFKTALRLLRRVALEVRSHAAELKTSHAVLLGAALHGTIMQHEVAVVMDKIESVQNSSKANQRRL